MEPNACGGVISCPGDRLTLFNGDRGIKVDHQQVCQSFTMFDLASVILVWKEVCKCRCQNWCKFSTIMLAEFSGLSIATCCLGIIEVWHDFQTLNKIQTNSTCYSSICFKKYGSEMSPLWYYGIETFTVFK